MGDPRWSYDAMLERAYWYFNKKQPENIDDAETFIKEYPNKDKKYYYGCGCAAGQVIEEVANENVIDEINALAGGIWMFENLIGVKEDDV